MGEFYRVLWKFHARVGKQDGYKIVMPALGYS